jgi:LacI family repressor for deo operon, udp, cdd, tsx, nupC, and nupG
VRREDSAAVTGTNKNVALAPRPRPRRRDSAQAGQPGNIRQVAAAARVSVATVSRAVQNPQLVAKKTRARVLAAIEKLDYTPNMQARILRTARSHVIVALVPDIANPFFAEVIRGIERVAHQHGYSVLLGDTQHSPDREQAYADLIGTRQADGLITLLPHVPRIAAAAPLPIVNACEYVKNPAITSVHVDNVAAAAEATRYLLTLGHKNIAFVSGPMQSPICVDRDRGYADALAAAGTRRDPRLTVNGDFSVESGMRGVESLFARGLRFTAAFCSNDEMAIGAIRAIKAQGLQVPHDVSVIGFDDIRFAQHYDPPLTTIAQPMEELGREAMSLLIEILQHRQSPPRKRVLPTHLVIRGSTARVRNAGP